jgi:hypothetical protein
VEVAVEHVDLVVVEVRREELRPTRRGRDRQALVDRPGGAPFQARTMPSSPSNRNRAFPPVGRTKPAVGLNTVPVGPPGTETTRPCFTPAALYSVDLLVPLSETHHGVVGPDVRPHAFLRSGSIIDASEAWLETSGTTA